MMKIYKQGKRKATEREEDYFVNAVVDCGIIHGFEAPKSFIEDSNDRKEVTEEKDWLYDAYEMFRRLKKQEEYETKGIFKIAIEKHMPKIKGKTLKYLSNNDHYLHIDVVIGLLEKEGLYQG